MSNVDIAALGQLTPTQPLDFTQYPSGSSSKTTDSKPRFVMPPAGEYILRAPATYTQDNFSVSKTSGSLMLKFNATIEGPASVGTEVRYIRLSAKTFDRDGQQVSLLGDFVKACGGAEFPGVDETGSPAAQVAAVEATAGKAFRAYLNWEAEDRKYGTNMKVRGMNKFPEITLADGTKGRQSFIEITGHTDEQGRVPRIWANLVISNFVTA